MDTATPLSAGITRFLLHALGWAASGATWLTLVKRSVLEYPSTSIGYAGVALLLLLIGTSIAELLFPLLYRSVRALLRREFSAYFLSPIAYAVLAVFLLVTGSLFTVTFNLLTDQGPRGVEFPMTTMLGEDRFWLVFLFIPPLLTMRLFAEERGTGTIEALMTAPIRDWQMVYAKYAACVGFYVFLWLPTLAYWPILMDLHATWNGQAWTPYSGLFAGGLALALLGLILLPVGALARGMGAILLGGILGGVGGYLHYTHDAQHVLWLTAGLDPWPVFTSYLGVFWVGAMFLALGLFVSSLVKSQMVAALLALTLGLPFIVGMKVLEFVDSASVWYQVLSFITVPHHFAKDFSRGVLNLQHLLLYAVLALFFLFLTVRSVESRRWR